MAVRARTLTGARAKLYIENSISGQMQLVGLFASVAYGVDYALEPIFVIGRYNTAELVYTAMNPISLTLTGFRIVGNGPYAVTGVPQLQNLLNHNDFSLALVDRQTGNTVLLVTGCRPAGYSSTSAARALHDLTVTVQGTVLQDESGPQEDQGAVDYQ